MSAGWGNGVNAVETGVQTINNGNWTGSVLTEHYALVGAANSEITSVSPSTAGFVLTSNGLSADPSFQAIASSGVASVSGTTNRITSTGGTTPAIDIAATYVGQSSITTLGTIATGVWNGTVIDLSHGGTAAALTASTGGVVYSGASALAILSGNATASKMLLSGASAAPTWSTSTIPTSAGATANKLLLSDGTNYVLSTPTFPNTSATTRKIIVSDGTNWVASTETYAVPGTSGNVMTSDGTNWTSAAAAGGSLIGTTQTATPFKTALGSGAATSTTGVSNTAVGYQALNANVSGTQNTVIGYKALAALTSGGNNMVLGHDAGYQCTTMNNAVVIGADAVTSASANLSYAIIIGATAGSSGTLTGFGPIAIGAAALEGASSGAYCVAVGARAAYRCTSGVNNITIGGYTSTYGPTTGSNNTLVGYQAGTAYTTSESANILIGASVAGVVGESNVLRIGDAGASAVTSAYIGGISGVATSNPNIVLINTSTKQLGSAATLSLALGGTNAALTASTGGIVYSGASALAILAGTATAGQIVRSGASAAPTWSTATYPATAGSSGNVLTSDGTNWTSAASAVGIVTINGNSGSITGSTVTIHAAAPYAGATVLFTNSGTTSYLGVTDGANGNTLIGGAAGNASYTGTDNTCVGMTCLLALTDGIANTVMGRNAADHLTGGDYNVFIGKNCAAVATTANGNVAIGKDCFTGTGINGSYNIVLGLSAGNSFTGTESSNIIMSSPGVSGDNNVIRIGTSGTGTSQQSTCYIAGIDGVTVTGTAVLVSTSGQLGDVVSSLKFKENVQPIENKSFIDLNPVQFNYKSDKERRTCFGMIAEEVEKIFPELVIHKDGEPYSLKYHEMPALLLAEIQKLNKRITALESR